MQLLQIKKSRSSDKVWLNFDDGSFIPFKIDDVVLYKIKTGIIDNYNFICELSLKFLLNNYALRQVAISPKITKILVPKLINQARYYTKKYNFSSLDSKKIIDDILDYLNQKNWLDKTVYANFLLKKHHKKSKQYLLQLFSFYGLDKSLLSTNSDKENIKSILSQKISKPTKPLDFKTKSKIIQSLSQKGFAYSDIKSVIDEIQMVR